MRRSARTGHFRTFSDIRVASRLCTSLTSFPQRTRKLSDLGLARWVTVAVGLVATTLAYLLAYYAKMQNATIVDLMPRTFNMFLGPLSALFIIGMFVPRATGRTAFVAVLLAMAASFRT